MIDSYETEGEALIEVLPNMVAGDCLTIHEPECKAWDEGVCTCKPILVRGPSGKA